MSLIGCIKRSGSVFASFFATKRRCKNEVFGPYSQDNGYEVAGPGFVGWGASSAATAIASALKDAGAEITTDLVEAGANYFLPNLQVTPTDLYQVWMGGIESDIVINSKETLTLHLKGVDENSIQIWVSP